MNDLAPYPPVRALLGLAAGLVGAAVMLASQKAEMRATGRPPSDTPTAAMERVSGVEVPGPAREAMSNLGQFAFGTGLGLGLALADPLPGLARAAVFTGGAWGAGAAALVVLGIAPPPTRWTREELMTDVGHHLVYGVAAASAYAAGRALVTAD